MAQPHPHHTTTRPHLRVALGDGLGDGNLLLRPWRSDDADAVVRACVDPEIPRWTNVPASYSEADAVGFLARAGEDLDAGTALSLAATDAATGELLGSIALGTGTTGAIDWTVGAAEIGYWVAPWARRRGVATRSVQLVSAFAFDVLGLQRLELMVMPGNVGSAGVALRAGFRLEERVLASRPPDGVLAEYDRFSLVRPMERAEPTRRPGYQDG